MPSATMTRTWNLPNGSASSRAGTSVSTMPPEAVAHFGEKYPMKRPAQPRELAPVYVMLASDEASYISGTMIGVTGGKPII